MASGSVLRSDYFILQTTTEFINVATVSKMEILTATSGVQLTKTKKAEYPKSYTNVFRDERRCTGTAGAYPVCGVSTDKFNFVLKCRSALQVYVSTVELIKRVCQGKVDARHRRGAKKRKKETVKRCSGSLHMSMTTFKIVVLNGVEHFKRFFKK